VGEGGFKRLPWELQSFCRARIGVCVSPIVLDMEVGVWKLGVRGGWGALGIFNP
jgi:hypothetical protein